ncbi:uncharacterized protein MKZ38_002936 [Zalerion maritima]|uniref:Dihydroorotate dehydrogenase catalytic domain-containing protein n=1 Tax=Zalerion maritima TaxID=339359 RepID=A0AAD5RNY6_9PEZI|nr:uncharacterized protein MKZ38_002936 [Zalerion maritima]
MTSPPPLVFFPPLLNAACPWATSQSDLLALWTCPSTGAITTRTSLPQGFAHDPSMHQHLFFSPVSHASKPGTLSAPEDSSSDSTSTTTTTTTTASLNTFGYSPHTLSTYLSFLFSLPSPPASRDGNRKSKLALVSVTGDPTAVCESYRIITSSLPSAPRGMSLAMEINLSCPNIPSSPPPAYTSSGLVSFLGPLATAASAVSSESGVRIPIGVKTPPYTHASQFAALLDGLAAEGCARVSFVTATNTLGGCLVLDGDGNPSEDASERKPALPGEGIGGMAGTAIHPLSLGNVRTLRKMLDERGMGHVILIGVGGVDGPEAYKRMRSAGADAVGIATALGRKGFGVFGEVEAGVGGKW